MCHVTLNPTNRAGVKENKHPQHLLTNPEEEEEEPDECQPSSLVHAKNTFLFL